MALTVEDLNDLARLLVEHPEWRVELRRLLLSEELLQMPELMRQLTEGVDALTQRLDALTERVDALAQARQRTETRIAELAAAQQRTEERIAELAAAQQRTETRLDTVIARQSILLDKLGKAERRTLEAEYREKAAGYFGHLIRRARVVPRDTLEDAVETVLSADETHDLLLSDIILRGRPIQPSQVQEVWLAVEASINLDEGDITRARRRAELLRRAGYRAIPVVAGESLSTEAELEAREQSVAVVQDGHDQFWKEALDKWSA